MTAALSGPVPPAVEDQPSWYALLVRVAAGELIESTSVRASALAALADHDAQAAVLARFGQYLAAR